MLGRIEYEFFQINERSFNGDGDYKSQQENHNKHSKVILHVIQDGVIVRFTGVRPVNEKVFEVNQVNYISQPSKWNKSLP